MSIPPHRSSKSTRPAAHRSSIPNLPTPPPRAVNTLQAATYLTNILGIPTAKSSLEVYRSQGRGPKYKRVGTRIYYEFEWLDEWARGIPVMVIDPNRCR